jgi:uncharacterized membrane protein YgdD (TMEM256/DUF423 family)
VSERIALALAAVNGFIAVAAGAFGAHGLRSRTTPELLAAFETGARYHMFHALALFGVAWMLARGMERAALGGWLLLAGIALFSGSLYVMALTGVRALGAITPIGGVLLLGGWGILVWAALSKS